MKPVTRSLALLARLLPFTFLIGTNGWAQDRVLDLTAAPDRIALLVEEMPIMVSNPEAGGRYKLPFKLDIRSIIPDLTRASFVYEVLLTNTSKDLILVPVAVDPGQQAVKIGQKGRRQLLWRMQYRIAGQNKLILQQLTVTDGAATDGASLVELRPQQSLLVRLLARTPPEVQAWLDEGKTVDVQANCEEWLFEDGRNAVQKWSQGEYSNNKGQWRNPLAPALEK